MGYFPENRVPVPQQVSKIQADMDMQARQLQGVLGLGLA